MKTGSRIVIVVLMVLLLAGFLGIYTLRGFPFAPPPTPSPEPTPEPTPSPSPSPEPTPELTPTPEPTPALRRRTELLTLVNPWHALAEDYAPELMQVAWYEDDDQFMDARAADAMIRMIADCTEAGNAPFICSSYRDMETQQYLFNNKIARLVYEEGVDPRDAPALAATTVALPGTSEHQLGLAADIIDYNYPYLNEHQEEMPTQKWLMEHCWDYGFILRYPSDKSDITGIIYEPWHYRYVGVEAAQEMRELGLTLEEYLDRFYEPLEERSPA